MSTMTHEELANRAETTRAALAAAAVALDDLLRSGVSSREFDVTVALLRHAAVRAGAIAGSALAFERIDGRWHRMPLRSR